MTTACGKVYGLLKAAVITNSTVAHIDFDESKSATGVTLIDGSKYTATKELLSVVALYRRRSF